MPLDPALSQPFSNSLTVDGQAHQWTTRGADFLMRPQAAPLDTVWVVPGISYVGAQLSLPASTRGRIEPVYPAPLKIAKVLQGQTFWRLWSLDNGEELLIRPRGCLLRTLEGRYVGFKVPIPPDFATAEAATMERWKVALNDEADWHRARQWLELSQTQRLAQLVDVSGGSWPELLALIGAAFVLWASSQARVTHPNQREKLELDLTKPGRVSLRQKWYDKPPEQPVDAALELLSQHWGVERVALNHPTRQWRECDEFGDPMSAPKPKFEWKDASHHERLEALLTWRDWLSDKLPPDEVTKMLANPPDLAS